MQPANVKDIEIENKNILVCADLEDAFEGSPRLTAAQEIIKYLRGRNASRIKVIGHDGDIGLTELLDTDINWNVRGDPREKDNDQKYAEELALGFDVYINESFATSHREFTSLNALPKLMKSRGLQVGIGLRFAIELEVLSKVFHTAGRKLLVIGGTKVKDKNHYMQELRSKFDIVLPGGLLEGSPLREDGLDITTEAVEKYKAEITDAKVIVAAGVMGKYEDFNAEAGTKEILTAIANSSAYKIAGGGDIQTAIHKYGLTDKFDWISVGGGAMLEYLATGTLPGIEVLFDRQSYI